jgi:hypothetical protein
MVIGAALQQVYPGGVEGFTKEGGRYGVSPGGVLIYHPEPSELLNEFIEGGSSSLSIPFRLVKTLNFQGISDEESTSRIRVAAEALLECGLPKLAYKGDSLFVIVGADDPDKILTAEQAVTVAEALKKVPGLCRFYVINKEGILTSEKQDP